MARKYDLADEYPHDIVEQMKELGLFGATIGEEYGGLGLSAWTYAQIVIKVAVGVDGAVGHLQFAPDRGVGDRAQRHRGAEAQIPAEDGDRRVPRQHRPDRAECGLRPAGDPHDGATRRRRLRRQRQQDVDHQQHVRTLHAAAGEDRSRRAAAPQGDEPADRREGPRLQRRRQAEEDGVSRDRHLRTQFRQLPRLRKTTCSAASRARASCRPPADSSWAASTSQRAAPASPKVR